MLILWCLSIQITTQQAQAQVQVSGNAIDLANMNVNMMHMKCPLEPCQSVCLKEQQETGCFICDPKCNTGSSLGMPNNGMPLQMQPINTGQTGFYSGCEHDNWMQCPMSCQRQFDQKGCFQCRCQSTSTLQVTASTTTPPPSAATSPGLVSSSTYVYEPTSKPSFATSTPTKSYTTNFVSRIQTSTATSQRTEETASTKKPISIVTGTVYTSATSKISQDDSRETKTPENRRQTDAPSNHSNNRNISTISTFNEKSIVNQNTNSIENNFKPNNLTFVLFGVILVLVTLSLVFFISWRKASRKLKKNKDELYFVHKAYRQDSKARLSNNEMTDPVYADISPRPEPPPRSPPSMRSNVISSDPLRNNICSDGPLRSLSQSSETPLKEHCEDFKHDYLELI